MVRRLGVSLSALIALGLAPMAARAADVPPRAGVPTKASVPAKDCADQADKQKLGGEARQGAISRCMKSVTSPTSPHPELQKNAITSPSGTSPAQRAGQCNAEANRRHLQYPARQSFQHTCLSGIGPVTAIGSPLHTPAKRGAVAGLGVVANGQQH